MTFDTTHISYTIGVYLVGMISGVGLAFFVTFVTFEYQDWRDRRILDRRWLTNGARERTWGVPSNTRRG